MSGSISLKCILCGAKLAPTGVPFLLAHPRSQQCHVVLTDISGVSADDDYEMEAGTIYEKGEPTIDPDVLVAFEQYTPVDKATLALFDAYKVERLGGASGDRGWSSFATFQKCPYLWFKTYVEHQQHDEDVIAAEPFGLAVGSIVHTLLALHYQRKIDKRYPITPEIAHEYFQTNGCNPEAITEAWRLFVPYRMLYKEEALKPLAVEYHLVDPHTKESTRYDLICEVTEGYYGREPGTYVCDHKTAQRFDKPTLDGWANDGTIIQQMMLWRRLGLHRRFGELKGVIVNLLGKQLIPHYHRSWVSPNRWQMDQQAADLKIWQAQKTLALATGVFPRSRHSCVGRYGFCSQFEHCATGEP